MRRLFPKNLVSVDCVPCSEAAPRVVWLGSNRCVVLSSRAQQWLHGRTDGSL